MILEKHLKTKRVGDWLMVTYLVDDRASPIHVEVWLTQRFPRVERSAIPIG